jgi:SAM-dependent methyltransferase
MDYSPRKVFLQYKVNYLQYLKAKNDLVCNDLARFDCHCNICGYRFENFLEFNGRKDAMCPICASLERHRHLFVHLFSLYPYLENKRILHFAPEPSIKYVMSVSKAEYFDADLSPDHASNQVDICNIPFDDNYFDYVIAIHVLEHIMDDHKAMAQIFRALKNGGTAILSVPAKAAGETIEDKNVTCPQERLRLYGQSDHVRVYSFPDFCSRLEQAGFLLKVSLPHSFPHYFQLQSKIGDQIVFAAKP